MGWPLLRALANERTTLKALISIRPELVIHQQPRRNAVSPGGFNQVTKNHNPARLGQTVFMSQRYYVYSFIRFAFEHHQLSFEPAEYESRRGCRPSRNFTFGTLRSGDVPCGTPMAGSPPPNSYFGKCAGSRELSRVTGRRALDAGARSRDMG